MEKREQHKVKIGKTLSAIFSFSFTLMLIVVCFTVESKKVRENARKPLKNALKDDFENSDSLEIVNAPY